MLFGDITSRTTHSQMVMIVHTAEGTWRLMEVRSNVVSLTVSGSILQKEN